jgi:PiT family inorganic phosphate transporter
MGIIAATIMSITSAGVELPEWVAMSDMNELHDWIPIVCFTAIAAGTMSGGWKIMKTMGNKITKITPVEGFCSQIAGSVTLFITQMFKVPVSTTHVISGSIMGVGAVKRLSAVRWGVTLEMITAWVLTIPISGIIAMVVYSIVSLFL